MSVPGIWGHMPFVNYISPESAAGTYINLSKSGDQVIENGTDEKVTFDGVASGTSGLFNDANDSVVVPSGASLVRPSLSFYQTNTRNYIYKNGTGSYNGKASGTARNKGMRAFAGPPLAVSAGDEFTFLAQGFITDGTHSGNSQTWLGLEVMDPSTVYALVKTSGNVSVGAGSFTEMAWDGADIADASNMHDPSSNNTRVTVPNGQTLARPFMYYDLNGGTGEWSCWAQKSGSTYNGFPTCDTENEALNYMCAYGAIVPVTGGTDYFTFHVYSASAALITGGGSGGSYAGVECFPSSYSYCTAYKSSTQALTANVEATLLLETEIADTDNCHSTASNQGNFVCPAGKTRARLSFNVKGASTSSTNELRGLAKKNGTHIHGLPRDARQSANEEACNGMGNWIPVTTGDVLRVDVTSTVNQTLPALGETWVCVEWA